MVRLPRNEKQTYRLNSRAYLNVTIGFDLDHDFDLDFSRSNMEFAISQPKMVWMPRNEKQTYWLNSRPQRWPMGLTLTITLTFEFWRSNMTFTLDHMTLTMDFHGQILKSCISEWEGRLTLHTGGGSRSFMTMTMTIWWPRSGVWIYQIVTGVTSFVGVPSTHLVIFRGHPSHFKVTWAKNRRFESDLSKITRPVAAIKSLRFALLLYS